MSDNHTPQLESFYVYCALQLARIHRELYPEYTNPIHVQGPKRPDMASQELQAFRSDQ